MQYSKWFIFFNVLGTILQAASGAPQAPVGNCLRFMQDNNSRHGFAFPYPGQAFEPIGITQDPIFSHAYISAIVGAEAKDCDTLIEAVQDVGESHPVYKNMLTALISADKLFKISAHAPAPYFNEDFLYGISAAGTSHVVNVKIKPGHTSHRILHESAHSFFNVVMKNFYNKKNEAIVETNIHTIFKNTQSMLENGEPVMLNYLELLQKKYHQDQKPLTKQEQATLKPAYKAIESSKEYYDATFRIPISRTHPFFHKISKGKSYTVGEILFDAAMIAPITVESITPIASGVSIVFRCDDALLATLARHQISLHTIQTEYQNKSKHAQDEEYFARVLENLPPELINIVYPQFLKQVNAYADKLLKRYPAENIVSPRGEDKDYHFKI